MTSANTDSIHNHILRITLIIFAALYLCNYFLRLPALNYIIASLLLYIVIRAIFWLPKVNRRIVMLLFCIGAILLLWAKIPPALWLTALMKNANLVTLFICVPMMSLPFFYEDYQGQLKIVAQTRMQTILPFCLLVTLCTHILGVLISIGAISVMYDLMAPNAKLYNSEDTFLGTLLRSYCSSGFWSPAWASVLVITAQTDISWVSLIPVGIIFTIIYNGINLAGIAYKIWRNPENFKRLQPEEGAVVNWGKIRTMTVLAVVLISSIIIASIASPWNLLIIIPLVSIVFPIFCGIFQKHLPEYKTGMQKYYNESLIKVQSVVALFTAAGFLGKSLELSGVGDLLPKLLPSWLFSHSALLSAAIIIIMMIPALLGVHPVVTGTALVSTIIPASIGMDVYSFALTIMTGWLLSNLISPFSAVSLVTSGLSGRSSWSLALGINGRFGLLCLGIFSILISLVGPMVNNIIMM